METMSGVLTLAMATVGGGEAGLTSGGTGDFEVLGMESLLGIAEFALGAGVFILIDLGAGSIRGLVSRFAVSGAGKTSVGPACCSGSACAIAGKRGSDGWGWSPCLANRYP
jgi:hypothetical protein